jgi:general secretion pathway protein J
MNRPQTAQGFTLMEVLIAMTLLSIMVVLLFASLKTCADSWEKGEAKIAAVNEVAVVYQFFKRHLATAQPLRNDFKPEDSTFSFQGDAHTLSFVSAFPASAAKAGLQLFSLRMLEEDDDRYLQVTLTPFFAPPKGEELPKDEVTLLNHVQSISLAYFGNTQNGDEGAWQQEWLERDNLPRLVKISIELNNSAVWPDMVIELKVNGSPTETDLEVQDTDPVLEEGE